MSKLCYKVGGTVKKYDLKDSANKPRLAVKNGGVTKYLGLNQGTKDGEVQLKLNGYTYYVQTKPYDYFGIKKTGVFSDLIEPVRAYNSGDRGSISKLAAWPIYDSSRNILAMIFAGVAICVSGKHSASSTNTTVSMFDSAPDSSSEDLRLTMPFSLGSFDDENKEVLYKVTASIASKGSNADKNRDGSQVFEDLHGKIPVTTLTIKNALLNKINTYAGNNPVANRADDSITSADYESVYTGTNVLKKPTDGGCYIRCFSSGGALNVRSYGYMDDYNWGAIITAYVEFPKNGLLGVTPSELITEWYDKVGKQMVFVSVYNLAPETILPIQPGLTTYADIYAAMQERGLNTAQINGRECHFVSGDATTNSAGTLQNRSNSKKVTFSITSFPATYSGYYKDGTKDEVRYLATDTAGYIYVVLRTNNVRAVYNYVSASRSYKFRYITVQSYGALKIYKYSYSASAGYTRVATYNS